MTEEDSMHKQMGEIRIEIKILSKSLPTKNTSNWKHYKRNEEYL